MINSNDLPKSGGCHRLRRGDWRVEHAPVAAAAQFLFDANPPPIGNLPIWQLRVWICLAGIAALGVVQPLLITRLVRCHQRSRWSACHPGTIMRTNRQATPHPNGHREQPIWRFPAEDLAAPPYARPDEHTGSGSALAPVVVPVGRIASTDDPSGRLSPVPAGSPR